MLRANYSRNITAAKNAKKKWWERKEGSLKEKKKAGNGKPVIYVTLSLRAVLTGRGKVEARKVCGQLKSQTLRNRQRQTEDPKMMQETNRYMSNEQIKWKN